ncbi:MAG TPA: gliding motility-associated C-terminal domain-containing protein, partial [Bacteroidia bacterium]|nr:gliding motility-associated C-terminal domain-containing protein [Bacteroidia bacterium]
TAKNDTVCTSSAASLSVTVNGTVPGGIAVDWYTKDTGGVAISSSNPYAFTSPAAAGTYTYYAGTCPGTYRIPVLLVVNPSTPPTLTVTATNTLVCSGANVTLTVSGAQSYTWGANAGSATTNTVLVNPSSNTTYTVTGANSGSCAGTSTTSITINTTATPTITITATSYSLCSGINDTLKASAGTALSYTWSSNASSATTSSVIVSPAVGATTYSVTGSNGTCTATQSVAINVTATPTVSILPLNPYICKGSNATLTASGATTSYSWSTSAVTSTVSVSPTSNTTYTVTGYNSTCSNTKTVLVKVDAGITKADSTKNSASCGQPNGSYILNSVTGGISPYQINFNGTGFSAIPAFSYTVNGLLGNSYPIIIKDSLGCAYTTSVSIGNTSAITSIDSTIIKANCIPANSGAISINSVTGGTAPYQANINGGAFSTIASFPFSFNNLIAGTYTVRVMDGTGCPYLSVITVDTVNKPTSANITTVPDTCNKHVGVITISSPTGGTGPYIYALNSGGAFQGSNIFTGVAASPNDTIRIKDNSGSGCIYTSPSFPVGLINSATTPTITASGNTTFCKGDSITLTSSSATNNAWNTGSSAQTITVSTSGVYTLTTTSSTGCSAFDTITVNVKPIPPTPVIKDTIVNECSNSIHIIPFNHSTGTTLLIYNPAGQLQTLPFKPTITGTTIYTAKDSLNGCVSAVKTITVTITGAPTTAPTVITPVTLCHGQVVTDSLHATPTSGGSILWEDANHNVINTVSAPYPLSTISTTYYVYQSNGSCPGTLLFDSIKVIVLPAPSPNFTFTPSTNIFVGQPVSFIPANTNTVNTYYWNFDDATSSSNTSSLILPTHSYTNTGSYCVSLLIIDNSSPLKCRDSTPLCLDILTNISLVIPNVFSPNDDGINDFFSVKATGIVNLSCDIFDRWGLKLYSWNGVNGFWDGTEKTKKAVEGTYFYVIQTTDVKGVSQTNKGFVELVK